MRAFLALLEREFETLRSQQLDAMFALAEEKNVACRRLDQLSLRRTQALATAGVAADRLTIADYMRQHSREACAAWDELIELAGRARELNRRNGSIIATQLQHNQQALAVLLSATDQAALYSADGQTRASSSARHLGSA